MMRVLPAWSVVPLFHSTLVNQTANFLKRFVLDTFSYQNTPLLVDGLLAYQGPALLACNDSVFSETDFKSLTSWSDSAKANQKAATGKFGLGFSSVSSSPTFSLAELWFLTSPLFRSSTGQIAHPSYQDLRFSFLIPTIPGQRSSNHPVGLAMILLPTQMTHA